MVPEQEYNPSLPEDVDRLLQDLIKYVAADYSADILVKAALLYCQFGTIHSFNSGNGRAGRLLPVALLMKKKILSKGCLFISEYFYKYNDVCLDLYKSVQHFGNYTEWIKFFMQCIIDSSNCAIKQLEEAVSERNRVEKKLHHGTKFTRELSEIYSFLEKKPVFMIKDLVDTFHMSYHTAANRIDMLVKMSVVKQDKEQHRNCLFIMQGYFEVFADDIARSGISSN